MIFIFEGFFKDVDFSFFFEMIWALNDIASEGIFSFFLLELIHFWVGDAAGLEFVFAVGFYVVGCFI